MRKINNQQRFLQPWVTVSVLIDSLLPLGEGPGKRE
jgi:hypothetical protein